ncbi:REP-associated tyrosine transposase [Arenimonas composti]|uniref:Transposase IS200-like domain-containing protein n=1 Tax=Arenimonas composti TR7-09 = DSM 18010 TaxID=1121013 RepID=A0A091BDJ6_9GAMM|nr:transposase [Arenimonas composti]KFN48889.1 hypothetical protein P873_13130 [Arenimonas composti TR7-09 = DSM 18010]
MLSYPPGPGTSALRRGRFSEPQRPCFVTWVTTNRERVFADFEPGCWMARLLDDVACWPGATVDAWILMPDHVHALIRPDERPLSDVIGRVKGRTAFEFNCRFGRKRPLWQRGFHDRAARAHLNLVDALRYMLQNPVRAGLVQELGEYPFWNCRWADAPGWLDSLDRGMLGAGP